jgi:hypothetical protein
MMTFTSKLGVSAWSFLIERLPFIASFLARFHNVASDLVATVIDWFGPGQSYGVFINVLNGWRSRFARSI